MRIFRASSIVFLSATLLFSSFVSAEPAESDIQRNQSSLEISLIDPLATSNDTNKLKIERPIMPEVWEIYSGINAEDFVPELNLTQNEIMQQSVTETELDDSIQRSFIGFVGPNYTNYVIGDGISILDNSLTVSEIGDWEAIGLLRNESPTVVGEVDLFVELLSEDGVILETVQAITPVKNVRPGEPAPFTITSNTDSSLVSEVVWNATKTEEISEISRNGVIYVDYEIPYGVDNFKGVDRDSVDYQIGTSFANIGESLSEAYLYVAWLDSEGKVVRMEETELNKYFQDGIPVEGSGSFTDIFVDGGIASALSEYTYSLWLNGEKGYVEKVEFDVEDQTPPVQDIAPTKDMSLKQTARFGDVPTTDVITAAGNNNTNTGLSTNHLAALMFSVTWPEVTGNDRTLTPSPMTVGRADTGHTRLYPFQNTSPSGPYARAFWNTGVGVFQIDSAGLGSNAAFHNRVLTNTASQLVAASMASRYMSASGTASQKRRAAWSQWYACGSNAVNCENNYNAIYSTSNDVISLSRDTTVARGGGMVSRTCYNTSNPSNTWACYKWNANQAQGHTDSWRYNPLNGSSNLLPVPLPFYTYSSVVGSNTVEYRHWLTADTGYTTSLYGSRLFGTNARNSVNWSSPSALGSN
ncbi:hypothetical protein E6C60_2788 [Paenibacillus algicola]|uniref:Uncharacterized protein n=1 Tax=Paenibacillus algicola TaxID=2565926 RepID=A0A4P8XP13_9BACL|nr:hypothetical protein [Paenibacillus algicola]QCT03500.1 hypothetical protein E6C60_2788 [Paenibacillus algicola]